MKKLRITLDGREYIVDVEILQDDEQFDAPVAPVARQPRNDNRPAPNNAPKPQPRPQAQPRQQANNAAPQQGGRQLKAPMNGVVLAILPKIGDSVKQGDLLAEIEAMKMKTNVNARFDGVVKTIEVKVGDTIEKNALLFTFE